MTNADMRKLMETIEQGENIELDEAGGIIDKGMAALGSKKAKGKVDTKKEFNQIMDGWKEYMGAQDIKKNDVEGFKKFLAYWNFDSNEINDIITQPFNVKDSISAAAKIQWQSGKGVTGKERGGPFKQAPKGDDYDSIIQYYVKTLGGNMSTLKGELASVKNAKQLNNDPLGMIGWSYLKAGKGK